MKDLTTSLITHKYILHLYETINLTEVNTIILLFMAEILYLHVTGLISAFHDNLLPAQHLMQ